MKIKAVFLLGVLLVPVSSWAAGPLDVVRLVGQSLRSNVRVLKEAPQGAMGNAASLKARRTLYSSQDMQEITNHTIRETITDVVKHNQFSGVSLELSRGRARAVYEKARLDLGIALSEEPKEDPLLRFFINGFCRKDILYSSVLRKIPTLLATTTSEHVKKVSFYYGNNRIGLGETSAREIYNYQRSLPSTSTCLESLFMNNSVPHYAYPLRFLVDSEPEKLVLMLIPFRGYKDESQQHGDILFFHTPHDFCKDTWKGKRRELFMKFNYSPNLIWDKTVCHW